MSDAKALEAKGILALGLSLGALSAAVAALPAALRISAGAASVLGAWLLLTGASALIVGPVLASVLRLRLLAAPQALGLRAISLGFLIAAGPLAALGAVLKAATHHRPLGGATFAVLALAIVLASVLCARRILVWSDSRNALRRRAGRGLAIVLAIVGAAILTLLLVRLGTSPGPARVGVFDGLRALGLGAIALVLPISGRVQHVLGRWGLAMWVGVVLVALALCRVPPLAAATERAAPVLTAPVAWLCAGLGGG